MLKEDGMTPIDPEKGMTIYIDPEDILEYGGQ